MISIIFDKHAPLCTILRKHRLSLWLTKDILQVWHEWIEPDLHILELNLSLTAIN